MLSCAETPCEYQFKSRELQVGMSSDSMLWPFAWVLCGIVPHFSSSIALGYTGLN